MSFEEHLESLLGELRSHEASLSLEAGELVVRTALPALPNELVSRLKAHRNRLVEILLANGACGSGHSLEMPTTERGQEKPKLLHALIYEQALVHPQAIALSFNGEAVSYSQLVQRADGLAQCLLDAGASRESIIGVTLDRSFEMVIAILAVVRAGCAYLPLDASDPPSRLNSMLKQSNARIVLARANSRSRVPAEFVGSVIDVEAGCKSMHLRGEPTVVEPDDLAYVIFTSGSTGEPKGCMVPHSAIWNRLDWMQAEYLIGSQDVILQKTPITFDVSVWELFWPLRVGARMVIAKPDGHRDPAYLLETIEAEAVTVVHFVPSMLSVFLEHVPPGRCRSLRHVFASGEALPYRTVEKFREVFPSARLHNLYGPTEAAVDVTFYECQLRNDRLVPIGRPISNTQIYILDEQGNPVADGREGEIHLSGACLARGYINQPALTAQRFVPSRWQPYERLYRTGDRGKWLDDGSIQYLGRRDSQVKLRGVRIELAEVEAALLCHPQVTQAVALVVELDGDDPKLVAYFTSRGGARLDVAVLREHLRTRLPHSMLPNLLKQLSNIPMTRNGKVDREALLEVRDASQSHGGGSATDVPDIALLEARIAAMVTGLLRCPKLDSRVDLFDAGATSLTFMRISTLLERELGIRLSLDVVLLQPTIYGLAQHVIRQLQARTCGAEGAGPPTTVLPQASSAGAQASSIEEDLRVLVQRLMGCSEVPTTVDLFDLGATSLTLMRLITAIEQRHGVRVPLDIILRIPTIAGMAAHVSAQVASTCVAPLRQGDIYAQSAAVRMPAVVELRALSMLLACLRSVSYRGEVRCLYPSAGGTYSVQVYVITGRDGVEGLCDGSYYFDATDNMLIGIESSDSALSVTPQSDGGPLLLLAAQLAAIQPIYGDAAHVLATLEAGYMIELLRATAREQGLELAPLDTFDERRLHSLVQGDASLAPITCMELRVSENLPP